MGHRNQYVILLEGRWEAMISKHLPISLYPAICPVREIRLIVVWLLTTIIYVWIRIVILRMRVFFKKEGIQPAQAPQGFFVYNYGSAGIFRRADWMVTLKGYTTDVWGSEIYTKKITVTDVIRVMAPCRLWGKGNPVSRAGSGFVQEGWDWNRLPGTTTIHLPFNLLDSPLKGTTMARSKENFSGSSSLDGKNGMFAMKLAERDYENFTPDFVAR